MAQEAGRNARALVGARTATADPRLDDEATRAVLRDVWQGSTEDAAYRSAYLIRALTTLAAVLLKMVASREGVAPEAILARLTHLFEEDGTAI